MEFFHSLTSLSAINLADKLKKQIHYVQTVLQIVNLILTWNKSDNRNSVTFPYLYIVGNGNANRAYIVKQNSILSFLFPLGISLKVDAVGCDNWIINKRDIVLTLPIISRCIDFANSIAQKKAPTKLLDIAKNIIPTDNVSIIAFDLLEYLLLTESCYIRYDNDPQHSNKYLHPKFHFDVNFSKDGTYKMGTFNNIRLDTFKDLLEKETNSWYIKKPKTSNKCVILHKHKKGNKSIHKRKNIKLTISLHSFKKHKGKSFNR